jgi:N-formylmaleamate deformylase
MTEGPRALTVEANGLSHRVWRWPGDGPPLLVVHGITNSARGWDFVCRDLGTSFAVHAVDLRGHGESDKPERGYAAADYAADLAGLIEALALERPAVLGHSLGARASARLAADRPELVSRLVLVDPPSEHRYPAQVLEGMNAFLKGVEATRVGGAATVRALNPHWSDEQVEARVVGHGQVSDRVMLDPIERYDPGTIFDDLPRIECPTLFVYGDVGYRGPGGRPGIVSAETARRALAALRQGELAFVPASGHMVPWDNFAGFIEPVRAFLRPR